MQAYRKEWKIQSEVNQLDFYRALVDLCPQATFTSSDVLVCCLRLQYIVNLWLAERDRPHDDNDHFQWRDEFCDLLERTADVAGIEPQLLKYRESGDWYGWLFNAARKLEFFSRKK